LTLERGVTIVIPAYNEEDGIGPGIEAVKQALAASDWRYEIVVVDDGSSDRTAQCAEEHGAQVIRLGANNGYGAALKAGIARAQFAWVAIIDADCTYPANELPRMLEQVPEHDMVVAARTGTDVREPFARRPAKWALRKLAGALTGRTIPDLNSGMRVIRKAVVDEFAALLPSGFSFTTTITLAMISRGYAVAYLPINYYKRVGRSKIKPLHVFQFASLIVRTTRRLRQMQP
jgi:glycosyltransferase involved in cell wall biosynthesis